MHKKLYDELLEEFNLNLSDQPISSKRKFLSYESIRDEVLRFLLKENLPLHKIESNHLKRLILSKCCLNKILIRRFACFSLASPSIQFNCEV